MLTYAPQQKFAVMPKRSRSTHVWENNMLVVHCFALQSMCVCLATFVSLLVHVYGCRTRRRLRCLADIQYNFEISGAQRFDGDGGLDDNGVVKYFSSFISALQAWCGSNSISRVHDFPAPLCGLPESSGAPLLHDSLTFSDFRITNCCAECNLLEARGLACHITNHSE